MASASGKYEKTSRCWPGYEPVPGKRPNEQGSCRKIPASRNGGVEVDREAALKKAIKLAKTPVEKARLKMKSSSPATREKGKRELATAQGPKRQGASGSGSKSAKPAARRTPAKGGAVRSAAKRSAATK